MCGTSLSVPAAGKTIIAYDSKKRLDEIIDRVGPPALTEHTITDRAELVAELEQVREQGYAYNWEEHVEGYCGIAVPIRPENEQSKEALTQRLRETGNEFELELKFPDL